MKMGQEIDEHRVLSSARKQADRNKMLALSIGTILSAPSRSRLCKVLSASRRNLVDSAR